MLDDRLDALLERARVPEPADDGFTNAVTAKIRATPTVHRRRWARLVTRPVALAAAAALVAGGALAAVSTAPRRDASAPPAVRERTVTAAPRSQDDPAATRPAGDTTDAAPPSAATSRPGPHEMTYREGSMQWGYTSEHTAYVIDHEAGLRMQTESYTNTFAVGEPHRVTMQLTNVGATPVVVYAPQGCAMTVAAYRAPDDAEDPASYRGPSSARDPSQAKVWNCAGEGDPRPSRHTEPDKFVLGPGASRTEHAIVVLTEEGHWALLGMCQCSWVRPREEPSKEPEATSRPSGGLLLPQPDDATDDAPSGKGWRMFTPPIRVSAS